MLGLYLPNITVEDASINVHNRKITNTITLHARGSTSIKNVERGG